MNDGWAAVAAAIAVVAVAAVREVVRWRGRRWQRSGPRGTDDPTPEPPEGPGGGSPLNGPG